MIEEWKNITGYEGLYQVSNLGKVKSLNYMHTGKEHLLKQSLHHGYYGVTLFKDGVGKQCSVHILVAQEFIPNPDNLPVINHKDEDKTNNAVSNIEWCTQAYNNIYGTRLSRVAEANYKPVVCVETGTVYNSLKQASQMTDIPRKCITHCVTGRHHTAGGYHFKYLDQGGDA